jgi:hypothetical protein
MTSPKNAARDPDVMESPLPLLHDSPAELGRECTARRDTESDHLKPETAAIRSQTGAIVVAPKWRPAPGFP